MSVEVASFVVAIAAVLVSIALHLWTRSEQQRQRQAEQRDVGELKAEISEIRDASQSANRLAHEALDEAKKAHVQRAELSDHQLAQGLLPRIDRLEKDGAQLCYEIGLINMTDMRLHRPAQLEGQREVVVAAQELRQRFLAGSLAPKDVDAEIHHIGKHYEKLVQYLREHRK